MRAVIKVITGATSSTRATKNGLARSERENEKNAHALVF